MFTRKVRGLASGIVFVGASLTTLDAAAMGYGYGMHPMAPMPMPPVMPMPPLPGASGAMPYATPRQPFYAAPAAYAERARSPKPSDQEYGYYRRDAATSAPTADEAKRDAAGGARIDIGQMRFEPAVIRIKEGETVTWRNAAGMPHTVVGKEKAGPNSGTLYRGQTFSHTFAEAGSYDYFCSLHPSMTAKVIVE